ncbi:unnamed protein product [Ilex paraguariensis]|uniref:Uncharacterized protein n=1 Tax=Ilex paraguariensis TaxID=185542 RepID=A0ABC8TWC9_9AQUA
MSYCTQYDEGCDSGSFTSPVPWIGLYVAASSLGCSLAMAADAFRGFRHQKLWFPCKFFTLNAASLTSLGVAMKLPVDVSTPMPSKTDQLAKFSSTVLMSTIMANFMPSLGAMHDKNILMNVTALGIFVITLIVNVCIQLGTGVIYTLVKEQAIVILFVFVLFVILSFSALAVPTTKKYLELKYSEMQKKVSSEESDEPGKPAAEKLKEDLRKYWVVAETGCPQFAMARSAPCSASGAICFLTAILLAEAELRIYFGHSPPGGTHSDYKWSTYFILVIQTVGVGIGTIAPVFRWFNALRFMSSKRGDKNYKTEFKTENYWIERLVELKERPLALHIGGQKYRKLVHNTKNLFLDLCIKVQILIVVGSKLVLLLPIFITSPFLQCCNSCMGSTKKFNSNDPGTDSNWESRAGVKHGSKLDLSRYVLHLEGEEELPQWVMKNNRDVVNHLIRIGKQQQPKYLIGLLENSTGFKGVTEFDSNQVPSLDSSEPPNCWTLPLVTLTSITIALPNIENETVDRLVCSVSEGLLYSRLVDKNLDARRELRNIRHTADTVWLGVELHRRWLHEDLRKMVLQGNTPKNTLERLAHVAEETVVEFKRNIDGSLKENPLHWPIKVIAANSMYRISQTILLNNKNINEQTNRRLFEQLSTMVADILGACLTSLPHIITMKCYTSTIEETEESVQDAAHLLGETEKVVEIVKQHQLPSLNPNQVVYIDEWRATMIQKNDLLSSPLTNEIASVGSGELHIAIDSEA